MRRVLLIRVLLQAVTTVMTISLVAICAVYASEAARNKDDARRVPVIIDISNDLLAAIQTLRLERGNVVASLVTPDAPLSETQGELSDLRKRSRAALDSAMDRLSEIGAGAYADAIAAVREGDGAFGELRREADAAFQLPVEQRSPDFSTRWVAAHSRLAAAIDRLSTQLENALGESDPFVARMLYIKQIAWTVRADAGRDRFRLALAIASGKRLTETQRRDYANLNGRIDGAWRLIEDQVSSPTIPDELRDAVVSANELYFSNFRRAHNTILADLAGGKPTNLHAPEWMSLATPGQESLFKVGNIALNLASAHAIARFAAAEQNFTIAIAFMVLFSVLGILTSLYVFKGVVRPIHRITDTMRSLAEGNLACNIPYERRGDEIGDLAHGLRVFRDNAIEKQRLLVEKDGAEAASRAKSEFLANVSHELRTPLNAVIGFSEAMKSEIFGPLSDRYRGYAGDIFSSGTHLLSLINEILDLSKLEAGRLELYEEQVDLCATIKDCLHLVETQAQKSNIRLSLDLDSECPFIWADERRFRQIIINLLSNAVKFTPENGRVRVSTCLTDDGLAVQVSDTGIGMAPEDIPKVLMPFGQVDSKISRKHAGTGLGLPLAKHLIELHGGTMQIESAVNAGTSVTMLLPLKRVADAPVQAEAVAGAA